MKEEMQETGTDENQEDVKFGWSCPCQDNDTLYVTQSTKNAEQLRIRTWSASLITLIRTITLIVIRIKITFVVQWVSTYMNVSVYIINYLTLIHKNTL